MCRRNDGSSSWVCYIPDPCPVCGPLQPSLDRYNKVSGFLALHRTHRVEWSGLDAGMFFRPPSGESYCPSSASVCHTDGTRINTFIAALDFKLCPFAGGPKRKSPAVRQRQLRENSSSVNIRTWFSGFSPTSSTSASGSGRVDRAADFGNMSGEKVDETSAEREKKAARTLVLFKRAADPSREQRPSKLQRRELPGHLFCDFSQLFPF